MDPAKFLESITKRAFLASEKKWSETFSLTNCETLTIELKRDEHDISQEEYLVEFVKDVIGLHNRSSKVSTCALVELI